ncbi:GIY-YIG nuclease family protein [Gramella jeungdoensis]|uniref:GIY-YIG nuclease family protein n=1 Tax=Gramella jeungdoensis TaxID=708091 RepID=A0ABT0Z0K4_9FLAO|nr:GIY-YIG nuclease family protein [Gramella jeungdoensis]MCM8569256.1 GIY-YIG nuclease family protein [Gramella jeungdoensis]
MHFLYIIHSAKIDRYYVGETADAEFRLNLHNQHYFSQSFTKAAKDWELKLIFKTSNREDALVLEKFVKRMKSRVFIEKIINKPEILSDILSKK